MATFEENINTIGTAIYGKEMRPAIKEALLQSRELNTALNSKVDELNDMVQAIIDAGGDSGGGGGSSDTGGTGTIPVLGRIIPPTLVVYGFVGTSTAGTSTGA